MRPYHHLAIGAALGAVVYVLSGSIVTSLMCFLTHFLFMDLDHFIDFWLYKRSITFSLDFFGEYHRKYGKLYLFFHSWELIAILTVVFVLHPSDVLLGLWIGSFSHLILDQWYNPTSWKGYFLAYRAYHKFNVWAAVRTENHKVR